MARISQYMFDKALAWIGASLEKAGIHSHDHRGPAVLLYGEPCLNRDIGITTLGVNIDRFETLLAITQRISLIPLSEEVAEFVRQTHGLARFGGGYRYS